MILVDQDTSKFCNRVKESLSNLKYHKITEIDLSDLVPEVTIKRLSTSHPIIVNQVIEASHDTKGSLKYITYRHTT